MSKIWQFPIEPLEERYSSQWLKWFEEEFDKLKISFESFTEYPISYEIRKGSFLDVIGTNYYKAQQLQAICMAFEEGRVKNGDVFFFHDGWFPGLEMIAYIRDALDIKVKLYSIFHAGTYDPWDFLTQKGMSEWGEYCERSWMNIYDRVFVATEYHKDLLRRSRYNFYDYDTKIHVTGLPIYPEFVKKVKKENIVVFPHRLDPEKQPHLFNKLAEELTPLYPDWEFIKSKDVCYTKRQYYDLLNRSKVAVSCALQETFGIAMAEAVLCGCVPVVPERLSYNELYFATFQYEYEEDLVAKLQMILNKYNVVSTSQVFKEQQVKIKQLGEHAISNMVDIMLGS